MSQYLPEQKGDSKGPESYLSSEERKALQRSLSFPEDLPAKFKSFLIDFIAVNIPQIPLSQIVGFRQFDASTDTQGAEANAQVSTGSSTYESLSGGPSVTVNKGLYVVHYGASLESDNVGVVYANIAIGAETPNDDYALTTVNSGGGQYIAMSRSRLVTISEDATVIEMKYKRTAFVGRYQRRWIVAQKYADLSS